jgi:hypothetical protein
LSQLGARSRWWRHMRRPGHACTPVTLVSPRVGPSANALSQMRRKLERVSKHQLRAGVAVEGGAEGARERWLVTAPHDFGSSSDGDDDDGGSRGDGGDGSDCGGAVRCPRGGDLDALSSGDEAASRSAGARRAAWRDQQRRAGGGGGGSSARGQGAWGGVRVPGSGCRPRAQSAPRYAVLEDASSSDEDDGAPLVHVLAKQVGSFAGRAFVCPVTAPWELRPPHSQRAAPLAPP